MLDNCKSAMICSATGDSMGWIKEFEAKIPEELRDVEVRRFHSWSKSLGGFWYAHTESMESGEYSDDTELRIATLRSMQYENWLESLGFNEMPLWTIYQRDGGTDVKDRVVALEKGAYPWNLGGESRETYLAEDRNGGLMRVLPHYFRVVQGGTVLEAMIEAVQNNCLTHGHMDSMMASAMYIVGLDIAYSCPEATPEEFVERLEEYEDDILNVISSDNLYEYGVCQGMLFDKVGEWKVTYERMLAEIREIPTLICRGLTPVEAYTELGTLGDTKCKASTSLYGTFYTYLAYEYLVDSLAVPSNTLGIDNDTIAGLVGGMKGISCKLEDLPEWFKGVQDYNYMCRAVDKLSVTKTKCEMSEVRMNKLKEALFGCTETTKFKIDGVMELVVFGIRRLPCERDSKIVRQLCGELDGGQRIYAKKYSSK